MLGVTNTLATFVLAAALLTEVSAGLHSHGISTLAAQRRRHHDRAQIPKVHGKRFMRKRSADCDDADQADAPACSDGQWQCSSSDLQVCDHGAWVTMQDCGATGLVCAASTDATGCVWPWQAPSSAPSHSAVASASAAASSSDDDECAESSALASSTAPASYAPASADGTAAPTLGSSSIASALASPTPAASVADGDDNSWALYTSALASASADAGSTGASATSTNTASSTITDAPQSTIGGDLLAHGQGGKGHSTSTAASASASDDGDDTASSSDDSWGASSADNQWGASSTADASAPASSSSTRGGHRHSTSSAQATASGDGASASASATSTGKKTSASGSSATTPSSGSWSAPHHVIYADNWLNTMPSADTIGQYNRFILAFWMSGGAGAVDDAQAWEQFDDDYRQQVLDEYHNAGIALMVSAFGSTDSPTSNGEDPAQTAQDLAAWVIQYGLDGVDIDYEDMTAFNNQLGEAWIITFQQTLRSLLPSGQYVISHAPVAPWFTSAPDYAKGGYKTIHEQVGSGIDWYNVQYYNQGDDQYVDCNTLINESGSEWPGTSVMELNALVNIPLDKIVIGKPNNADAASNGYMQGSSLAKCVAEAQQQGWNAGVMFWEWDNAVTELLATVLG